MWVGVFCLRFRDLTAIRSHPASSSMICIYWSSQSKSCKPRIIAQDWTHDILRLGKVSMYIFLSFILHVSPIQSSCYFRGSGTTCKRPARDWRRFLKITFDRICRGARQSHNPFASPAYPQLCPQPQVLRTATLCNNGILVTTTTKIRTL